MAESSPQPVSRASEHQRAYKACIPCRKRKAKCDLGGREGPPCLRCRRELRECVFSAERSWNKKRKLNENSDGISHSAPTLGRVISNEYLTDNNITNAGETNDRLPSQRRDLWNDSGPGYDTHETDSRRQTIESYAGRISISPDEEALTSVNPSIHGPVPDLTRSVMSTVVSNGNDALNLLFQAAAQDPGNSDPTRVVNFDTRRSTVAVTPTNPVHAGTRPILDVYKLWRSSRFVKMGWLTAEEIVIYLDLFFKNMAPLSPVLSDFYADHANHSQLVTEDPLLCCTILMISSRYHPVPRAGGASRSYFIHDRFWKYCQHLITRLIFGQDKGSNAKTRTIGSIEALLLLSEWHPRSLHFPPEADGWDSDLIPIVDDSDSIDPTNRWLEDVIEPARRSDRMSWMLLGCASSLAHELDLFGEDSAESATNSTDKLLVIRKHRARKLLYVFVNQLASRLGTMSTLPQNVNQLVANPFPGKQGHWTSFMSAWIELTKLLKSLSEMVFSSESHTHQLLQSGRYVGLLELFQPLLEQWRAKYLEDQAIPESIQDVLFIEYQCVRVYCNSIGMQAVCQRACAESGIEPSSSRRLHMSFDTSDQVYIEEVITGSCEMLERVISLAEKNTLRFAPVRVFLRVVASSVFLLKGMSIGIKNGQLRSALSTLNRCVQALRSSVLDDMHLASSFASLLEMHIQRLQKGFIASSKRLGPSRHSVGPVGGRDTQQVPRMEASSTASNLPEVIAQSEELDNFLLNMNETLTDNDWLSLPFDPTMAPFGLGGASTFPVGLDDDGLNFIWNLPA